MTSDLTRIRLDKRTADFLRGIAKVESMRQKRKISVGEIVAKVVWRLTPSDWRRIKEDLR
jgi:hypothetical protein